MKKRLLALLLCLTMLCCLFVGCSSDKEETAPAEESTAAEPSAEDIAREEEKAAALEESAVVQDAVETVEGLQIISVADSAISYPLADPNDPIEILQYNPWPSLFDVTGYTEWNDLPILDTIQETTGVKYTFMTVSTAAQTEQFNLMMASGDWVDVINAADYYTGGQQQAYAEEIIYDLTDIIPEAAPEYWNYLQNTNQATIDSVQEGGKYLGMCVLYTYPYKDQGPIYRADWLEELGLPTPTNFEEYNEVLYAFKDKGNKSAIYVDYKGTIDALGNIFDCSLFDVSGNATGVAPNLVVETGKYHSDLVSDNYREYLEYFHQLFVDGVIADDFYTTNFTDTEKQQGAAAGDYGIWSDWADAMYVTRTYTSDPNFDMVPGGKLFNDEGLFTYGTTTTMADNKGYNVTTQCEYPELVCSFWNYFFTEEGMVMANYGIEGKSWEFNDSGIREFTDFITNNPDGINPMIIKIVNMFSQTPMLKDNMASITSDYDAEGLAAIEVWSDLTNQTSDHEIPAAAELNTEETNAIATIQTDIITYATEEILKFMIGTTELNDDTWGAYVDQCYALGLQTVIDTYQNAYDEYLAGDRVVEAPAGGPGGPPPGGDMPPPDGDMPPPPM